MSDSSDDEVVGPMPAADGEAQYDGARLFAEREARQREAAAQESAAQRDKQAAETRRPEWMLTMPTGSDHGSIPTRALRARGFQQSHGRPQHVAGESVAEAQQLWTETPEQRRERLTLGHGHALNAQNGEKECSHIDRERISARDAAMREQVERYASGRQKSLVEQHEELRREELRRKRSRHEVARHDSGRESYGGVRDSGRDHRRHSHHRHRHYHHDHDHDHDHDQHRPRHSHRSSHRHSRRSRSPPRRMTRAEREEEDRRLHGEYAPLLFDKDRMLGKGSRLMDERARSKSIADAAHLSTRFSSGQSGSFL